ncbi:MAG: AMP-binding protein, partial [Betaproteobacteria bacterium]|nr:AMP-binding protein [Betaproteobacteria bacterium]
MNYADFHRTSIEDPEKFWRKEAERIDWHAPFDKVLDYSRPPFASWFVGGQTNLCHNAVDRWASSQGEQTALIAITTETPDGTPAEKIWSFKELQAEVERMAAIMQSLGVVKGDTVLIYMPMIAEAVFAMLACARIGAIHSVVFGGFASNSLATRIEDAQPKLIVSADAGS